MPNYVGNRWTISGPKTSRDILVKSLEGNGEVLSLNSIIPQPPLIKESKLNMNKQPESSFTGSMFPAWYKWRIDNWGTKWEVTETTLKNEDDETIYTFLTAWGPLKRKMIQNFIKKYPELTFDYKYAERGIGFYGQFNNERCIDFERAFEKDDFLPVADSNKENYDYQQVLKQRLSEFQELYDMSG